MASAAVTYSFTSGTTAVSAQVNQDFTDLVTFLNTNVVHVDGSKTMTGALTLPASDPASANQAARKSYVDTKMLYKGSASTSGSVALVGSVPTTDTQLLFKSGTWSGTSGVLGNVDMTFSTAFPTNLLSILITVNNASLHNNTTGYGVGVVQPGEVTAYALSTFTAKFFMLHPDGITNIPAASKALTFSWIAVGN